MRNIAIGPNDSVILFAATGAPGGGRRLTFSPQLEFVRTTSAPLGPAGQPGLLFHSDGRAVVLLNSSQPRRVGYPLHLIDAAGEYVRSFGRDDPSFDPAMSPAERSSLMVRALQPAPGGTFWSNMFRTFLVERWDFAGRRISRWESNGDGWYRDFQRAQSSAMTMFVLSSRRENLVWILYALRDSAQGARAQSAAARGTTRPIPVGDMVAEARDLRTSCLLAVQRFSGQLLSGVVINGPDLVSRVVALDPDYTTIRVSRLALSGPVPENPRC
jgi:hypothetical protein